MSSHEDAVWYKELAEPIILDEGWDVLEGYSDGDYQGSAEVLLEKDGQYAVLEWSWGSCAFCDAYMDYFYRAPAATRQEFRADSFSEIGDLDAARKYFQNRNNSWGGAQSTYFDRVRKLLG